MNDSAGTQVFGSHGPVHTGNGPQFTFMEFTLLRDSPGRNPRSIADDQLLWLWRRFVHPTGFGEARHILGDTGTVLLDGAPGSGRTSAARVLLHELRHAIGAFRELLPGEEGEPLLGSDSVADGDRLLLDLSDAEEPLWADVRKDLSSLRKTVRDHRAHLVVVLPHRTVDGLAEDLNQYRVEITRPRGKEVLLRHLRADDVPPSEYAGPAPALADFLASERPMREIAGFAALVVRARAAARTGEDFADWCERARTALSDRGPQVAGQVTALRAGPQRALLLSTAMLHGTHPDIVHRGAASLLRTVKYPKDDRPLLEHADLAERLKEICARPDPTGLIHFDDLEYDTAVRAHFWDHMPDLREHLRAWVGRTVELADPRFSRDDRDLLVERLTDQYLRTARCEELASLAEQWAAAPATDHRLRAAARALECGLHHEEHGRFLRKRIYEWSKSNQVGEGLAQVLVAVCAEVIAVRHPDQAMVRLHHLARRERQTTRALDALCRLVEADHRLHRRMLHRLASERAEGAWPADLDLFLRLADPIPLTDPGERHCALLGEPPVRDWLTTGWNIVFGRLPSSAWTPRVRHWLHTACADEHHGDPLLDVLVAGAGQRGDVFGALYATARQEEQSVPGGQERGTALTDLLLRKISIAQGIRPTTAPPRQSTRGTTP